MAPFCMNSAKKSSGGGPLDPPPPPSKHNSFLKDPIIHINTEKINIKTFQQIITLYYMQVVCKTWKAGHLHLHLTSTS